MVTSTLEQKEKSRWNRIKRTYGLSKEDYNKILEAQDGRCFICQRTVDQVKKSKSKYLTVDHCHQSGRIRGLLCSDCNGRILPSIREDTGFAFRAFEYLYRDRDYGIVPERTQARDRIKKEKKRVGRPRKRNFGRKTKDAR